MRDVYVRGKYRDVIIPMTLITRLDSAIEPKKSEIMKTKESAVKFGWDINKTLTTATDFPFYNISNFRLKDLKNETQIVEKIDRFMENQEKLISIINEKIDSLISLNQSLISEVVTGKIDVRDIKIPYYEKIDISNEKQEHLEERQV